MGTLTWAALVCGSLVLLWVAFQRLGRTRRAPGDTLGAFLRHFEARGVPAELSIVAFHHFQRWMRDSAPSFPVRPQDDLARIYGIAADELDEAVAALLADCGRRAPADAAHDPFMPRATIEDLVLYLAACPLREEPPACD